MVISDSFDTIRLLFVTEKKPFLRLKSILGFYPHHIEFYRLALMHKSVAYHEHDKTKSASRTKHKMRKELQELEIQAQKEKDRSLTYINNERLEFLGDAMLGAIVADILYKHYGCKQEGFLTNLRSKIVCRKSLNKLAVELGLDKLVKHTGAVTTGHNSFMNGNAFEAFVGAIYLDRGFSYCYRFLEDVVFKHYINIEELAKKEENFKSALLEWCQKFRYKAIFDQQELRAGKGHNVPMFHSTVLIESIPCGTGNGYSKKESDQNAAKQAFQRIKRDKDLLNSIKNARKKPTPAPEDEKQ
ncbi:MAG: ribonuclease III [Bacteroidaceae bacterium]|nr:ribonuclease III [Bacteroidaceae bacterium]